VSAIQQDQITWKQTWDKNNVAANQYGVRAIPFTVLLDPKGNPIQANLRGPALEQKLEEIFGY
jgi:hypothetical protein